VVFVVLPRTGLVAEIERRQYPRDRFFDPFLMAVGVPGLHFEDVPALRQVHCPDGSHLDYRDRASFTAALVRALRGATGRFKGEP
jgi:hypothetical protein